MGKKEESSIIYLEPFHQQGHNHIPLLVGELLADPQEHEHVVTPDHTHGVQVT